MYGLRNTSCSCGQGISDTTGHVRGLWWSGGNHTPQVAQSQKHRIHELGNWPGKGHLIYKLLLYNYVDHTLSMSMNNA